MVVGCIITHEVAEIACIETGLITKSIKVYSDWNQLNDRLSY